MADALPPGVTLEQIDGGPSYYSSHGFTYAANAGWDDPSFFPIGVWYAHVLTQADADRWKDLGLNTVFALTDDTSLSLLRSNGIWAIIQTGHPASEIGSETVGLLTVDEPNSFQYVSDAIASTPNSLQDGRYWWFNNTWNFIEYGLRMTDSGQTVSGSVSLTTQVTTPNGTKRHIDIQSIDQYWFAGGKASNWTLAAGGILYDLGRNMTIDEAARGSHYGDMVDRLRALQTTYPAPIAAFIETGGAAFEDTSGAYYITPPEMNWAVWSSIIHGARQIIYYNHSHAGPAAVSIDNFAQPYFQTIQPGQSISIYDQAKATNALIEQLAPVINSPTALGYVTVNPAPTTFSGIETMAKYYNGEFYIFADTRFSGAATNINATLTINDPDATSVTVINENRTLSVSNEKFTDTFATGSTVHIYKVNVTVHLELPGSISINDVTISEGNSGTNVATFTVTRSGGTAAFDVNYATSNGTATVADGDYVAASNTLHFATNENAQTISVTINGDTKVEPNETFNVVLSNATNGATLSDSQGVGTITNDDAVAAVAGSVSINDVTISEGNSGTKVATFTVTRSGGTAAFDVNYATSDGTATVADGDYVAASNTLHFGANENTQTISVTINGDTKVEANETFNVVLSNATNGATISDGQGVGTITNDDSAGNATPNLWPMGASRLEVSADGRGAQLRMEFILLRPIFLARCIPAAIPSAWADIRDRMGFCPRVSPRQPDNTIR